MKVCIYSRVSTGQQDTTNQSVALSEWAKQRGFEVVKVYDEEESAWKSGHQGVLASLIADTRQRRFQAVLVWALDRLSHEGWLATTKTFGLRMSKTLPGLRNFYMVGQWVEPGGGLPPTAMSGRNVTQIICKKDKRPFVTTTPI